jgi:ribosomal protein S28E/S33
VLAVADLPGGTFVDEEEYGTGVTPSFNRRFVLGNRRIGRSQLASLETTVERAASARQALTNVVTLALVLDGPQGEQFFAEGYASGARFRPEDVDVEVLRAGALGNAFVARARFRSPLGRIETVIGMVAVGRDVGRISAVAPEGRVVVDDVVSLLETQARRMATR